MKQKVKFEENVIVPNFMWEYSRNYICMVANIISKYPGTYNLYEIDVFAINKNKMIFEFEIKTSVNDFRKDSEKGFSVYEGGIKIFKRKYDLLKEGKLLSNYFVYVMPKSVYEEVKEEIPLKAGVITFEPWSSNENRDIMDRFYFYYIKSPKRLHKEKASDEIVLDILHKLQLRYINTLQGSFSRTVKSKKLKNKNITTTKHSEYSSVQAYEANYAIVEDGVLNTVVLERK